MSNDLSDLLHVDQLQACARADVVVIGAGACGLVAALAARDAGASVIVLERDATPSGSTSLASGFIPAAGTRFQRAAGIADDTPALLAADILTKAKHRTDPGMAAHLATEIGPALEWLHAGHGIPFQVLQGFRYPGHSRLRMHAVPEQTGSALLARLLAAAESAEIAIITEARAGTLFAADDGRIGGVRVLRPDGAAEDIGCSALVLACNGYGGAPALLRRHIPEMAEALYFGHAGNQGCALRWGTALGAASSDLGAYQGHGSVAHPHGVLITWALMMEGGVQINSAGERFWNEQEGYSEAATAVLAQPDGIAWCVFDARLHGLGLTFEDYRQAHAIGAIRMAADASELAALMQAPEQAVAATLAEIGALAVQGGTDRFGRVFDDLPLAPPYHAVRVTGALFHTQGGLNVDHEARVKRVDGTRLPNLFAGGGAARGVSGPAVWGYLSGNGLLSAVALGRLAGHHAAAMASRP
jgi:fumarate reductase flavoprotein subunit